MVWTYILILVTFLTNSHYWGEMGGSRWGEGEGYSICIPAWGHCVTVIILTSMHSWTVRLLHCLSNTCHWTSSLSVYHRLSQAVPAASPSLAWTTARTAVVWSIWNLVESTAWMSWKHVSPIRLSCQKHGTSTSVLYIGYIIIDCTVQIQTVCFRLFGIGQSVWLVVVSSTCYLSSRQLIVDFNCFVSYIN